MKKIISLIFFAVFLAFPPNASANEYYSVDNFQSQIIVEKNTDLLVTETIDVNFFEPRHGIYRTIPVVYSYRGKTINSRIQIISVENENGEDIKFEKKRQAQSLELKIGDPEEMVTGFKTYRITYTVSQILQKYSGMPELYWNVTGHEWDTEITRAEAIVTSSYSDISEIKCFSGIFGERAEGCESEVGDINSVFKDGNILPGEDFTIVVSFSPVNQLIFPGKGQQIANLIQDNWGYLLSPIPLYYILFMWMRRGRDKKYTGANIYYKEESAKEETKPIFSREHLPLVYHPIQGLSPAEVGTIVDEKVDIEDVIAEITELARLGFLQITKMQKRKMFNDDIEYAFIKTEKYNDEKERSKLNDYQEYLLQEIFRSTIIHKSVELAEKFFKGRESELAEVRQRLIKKEYALLGAMKNHFYEGLPVFKNKLYERMGDEHLFYENPEKVRGKWVSIYIIVGIASAWATLQFGNMTANYGPVIGLLLISIPGLFVSMAMPRRTPKGYSYKRQIEGLSWYLEKGKWRYEVQEKKLFIEEVLPIAIALGIVNDLARDMADLGIKPPQYFSGTTASSFSNDVTLFKTSTQNAILTTPGGKASGLSSWSGGSGFSGGSSGGGFGGGGGGSW